jgi:diguanylate cyclase (GGDEF)-like protein
MLPLSDGAIKHDTPLLRIVICIFFFPCFLLMDKTLTSEIYYLAGITFSYALILYLLPKLNSFLNSAIPLTLLFDTALISAFIYFSERYMDVFSYFYMFPIIAAAFGKQAYYPYASALLSGFFYIFISFIKGLFLLPVIIKVIIFFTLAFFTRFLVQHINQTYFQQANQDTLTKIHNRRFFNFIIHKLITGGTPFSLILLDLDNFKLLNDTQGHHHGDYVLKIIAGILRECTRSYDVVARYGGDEFAVILPNSPKETSKDIAERIRNRVLTTPKLLPYPNTSISIGIASFPADADNGEEIMKKADEALYKAKGMGKNYVSVYQD